MTQKTVLIADDDHDLVDAIAIRCRQLALNVVVAYDARTALARAYESHPDLICLDVKMPHGSGLSVCEMLTNDAELSSIPVIVMTGISDHETIRRCHEMCAFYVLKSDKVWDRLRPILCEILDIEFEDPNRSEPSPSTSDIPQTSDHSTYQALPHLMEAIMGKEMNHYEDHSLGDMNTDDTAEPLARQTSSDTVSSWEPDGEESIHGKRILYIEDDAEASNALKIRLESLGMEVIQAFDGREGYRLGVTKSPDLVLCDYFLPEGNGDYVLRRFRENPATEDIPIIFLTGQSDGDIRRRMIGQDVAGYLTKPVSIDDLLHELSMILDVAPIASSATPPRTP